MNKIPPKPCPVQRGAPISHESCGRTKDAGLCNSECEVQPKKDVQPTPAVQGNLFYLGIK